ncbi:radical SAM protein [Maridesulfovibrio hydrothermalis]|uniref:Radical SAM domain protein n=1 Tax=Maridesulfovibrio hydrothermalis AM13 = DSM 14728 TaxID=1121451 RepID=L0R784_9BACT|nr:radical SAM protein [Maridesulfovibrio hydrothermalis]CCO22583.1 Radical SAM domain protein [Maridesulfovibrio hydrothermalis AM13 = DSM 14728]
MDRQQLIEQDKISYQNERGKKAVVSYPPRWMTLGISGNCTNRCLFCSYHSEDARNGKSNVYNLVYKMSLQHAKEYIDLCYKGRIPHVHICGSGEPFLNKDIMPMVDYMIERYGKASFQSNFNESIMKRGDYIEQIIERKKDIAYIVTDMHTGDESSFHQIKKGSSLTYVLSVLKLFSKHGITLHGPCILTRSNYKEIPKIIELLIANEIQMDLLITGIYPHMFNDFTSMENVYQSSDTMITDMLNKVVQLGKRFGITVTIPQPFDSPAQHCDVFWDKIQVWPTVGVPKERYHENLIPHACNAVVLGEMASLGYLSDYESVMDFWNNDIIVNIRKKILAGKYPDSFCWSCPHARNLKP